MKRVWSKWVPRDRVGRSGWLIALILSGIMAAAGGVRGYVVSVPDGQSTANASYTSGCTNKPGPNRPACDCPPCPEYSPSSDAPTTSFPMQAMHVASSINNLNLTYVHDAVDYQTAMPSAGGCSTCGGGGLASGGELPGLRLDRIHRYRLLGDQSSFGPGVACNYDLSLLLDRDSTLANGAGVVTVIDPLSVLNAYACYDVDANGNYDGVYYDNVANSDTGHKVIQQIRLLDATGNLVVDQRLAITAVVISQTGWVYTFQVCPIWSAGSNGLRQGGRLTSIADRNGNSISVAYVYAVGSPTITGLNAYEIASVTDAYGKTANFHYSATKSGGRWVVDYIDLPAKDNGSRPRVNYTYGTLGAGNNASTPLVGLAGVTLADGTTSTFSSTYDAASQCIVISIFDAGASTTHRNKKVYMTRDTWTDPATGLVYTQVYNRVRMVVNGSGEVAYLNWLATPANRNADVWAFIYQGGGSLFALQADSLFRPKGLYMKRHFVAADLGVFPAVPLSTTDWEPVIQGATYDTFNRMLSLTDAIGRTETYVVEPNEGGVTQTTYHDNTTSSTQYDATFRWPLLETDRLGRQTHYVRDAHGNVTSKTTAYQAPMAQQSTWQWNYNARGQIATATDADGNVTTYAYYENAADARYKRLNTITQPPDVAGGAGGVTTFDYDARGLLKSVTDPVNRQTQFAYDDRGRLTTTTYADSSTETITYGSGANANLVTQSTDRTGNLTTYAYDLNGREVTHVTASGTSVAATVTTTYLNGTNQPASVTDRGNTTSYIYDNQLRLASTTVTPNGSTTLTRSTAYLVTEQLDYVTDPYGRKTYYAYDVNDRPVRIVRETVAVAVTGLPADYSNATGYNQRTTTLLGLARILSANAKYLIDDIANNAEGQATQRTDGNGNISTSAYDTQGRLTDVVEASGTAVAAHTQSVYDAQGNVTDIHSPRDFTEAGGFVIHMTYTGRNLPLARTEAFGRAEAATENWTYYLDGREQNHVDFRGNTWTKSWGACCGRLQAQIEPLATVDTSGTPKQAARTSRYNDYGDLTHEGVISNINDVTFPVLGGANTTDLPDADTVHEITTRFDARHRPIARTVWLVPLGPVDANHPPIAGGGQAGDPPVTVGGVTQGLTTTWTYDENLTDGAGLDANYAAQIATLGAGYFGAGFVGSAVQVTNPNGENSTTILDGTGRTVLSIDGLGHTKTLTYDAIVAGISGSPGSLVATTMTDALSHSNTQYVDAAGRTLDTRDAENNDTLFGYDAGSNQLRVRDPNGVGQDCLYDARNRKTQCTDTHLDVTKWAYDANTNLIHFTDAKNVSDTSVYDGRDRRTSWTSRLAGDMTSWTYDGNNNNLTLTDAQNGVTSYTFDARNLKTLEAYPDDDANLHTGVNDHVTFAYDAAQRLLSKIDQASNTIAYVFDMGDRLTSRNYPDTNNDTFTFDLASRMLTAASARYSNTVTRTYDAAGRLTADNLTVGGSTYNVGIGYDNADRNNAITYPDSSAVTRNYTARNLLQQVQYTPSGGAAATVATRTYDVGMRLSTTTYGNGLVETRAYRNDGGHVDDQIASIAIPSVTNFTYTYDANKNKTAETDGILNPYSWATGPGGYDAKDRLTGWNRTNGDSQNWNLSLVGDWSSTTANGVTDTRTHNPVHELLTRSTSVTALTYDARGNLTTNSNGQTYTWDYDNRMSSATVTGTVTSYAYDALGRRVSKSTAGITTLFVSVMSQEITEYQAGTLAHKYVFGSFVDEPLMMQNVSGISETTYYYHVNSLYCVAALTDSTGAPVERYVYNAYGKVTLLDATGTNVLAASVVGNASLYTGRRLEVETGLYYYRARYYDANGGRFVARDSIDYSDGYNLYEFTHSSPENGVDPSGTRWTHMPGIDDKGVPIEQGARQEGGCFDKTLKYHIEAQNFNPPNNLGIITGFSVPWTLTFFHSPGNPMQGCCCCPDGSQPQFKFKQTLDRTEVTGGRSQVMPSGRDNVIGGIPGVNQTEYRDPKAQNGGPDGFGGCSYTVWDSPSVSLSWLDKMRHETGPGPMHLPVTAYLKFTVSMYRSCSGQPFIPIDSVTFTVGVDANWDSDNHRYRGVLIWGDGGTMTPDDPNPPRFTWPKGKRLPWGS